MVGFFLVAVSYTPENLTIGTYDRVKESAIIPPVEQNLGGLGQSDQK
jgi:hypothetical protein